MPSINFISDCIKKRNKVNQLIIKKVESEFNTKNYKVARTIFCDKKCRNKYAEIVNFKNRKKKIFVAIGLNPACCHRKEFDKSNRLLIKKFYFGFKGYYLFNLYSNVSKSASYKNEFVDCLIKLLNSFGKEVLILIFCGKSFKMTFDTKHIKKIIKCFIKTQDLFNR